MKSRACCCFAVISSVASPLDGPQAQWPGGWIGRWLTWLKWLEKDGELIRSTDWTREVGGTLWGKRMAAKMHDGRSMQETE